MIWAMNNMNNYYKETFFIFTLVNLKFMENIDQHHKDQSEKKPTDNDVIKNIIDKRALLEEKFNQVNARLDLLKADADKLLHPEKPVKRD